MNQQSTTPTGFVTRLGKILFYLEFVAILLALVGAFFNYMHIAGGAEFLLIGLGTLSAVYFLRAFAPAPPLEDDRKSGFFDLLGLVILPKVSGIASAVALIGILFVLLQLKGAEDQLVVGLFSLFATIVLSVAFIIMNSSRSAHLVSWLFRTVPIALVGSYYFFGV